MRVIGSQDACSTALEKLMSDCDAGIRRNSVAVAGLYSRPASKGVVIPEALPMPNVLSVDRPSCKQRVDAGAAVMLLLSARHIELVWRPPLQPHPRSQPPHTAPRLHRSSEDACGSPGWLVLSQEGRKSVTLRRDRR